MHNNRESIMKLTHYTFILFFTAGVAVPLNAQNAKPTLDQKVTAAVRQAQITQQKEFCPQEPLSTQELIEAEEELSIIRNRDINATFEKYPYLLDPAYRRHIPACTCPCKTHQLQTETATQQSQTQEEELDTRELIEAEEELSLIRNTQDNHATFDKYPYLLKPAYRRGDEKTRQKIRQDFEKEKRKAQSTRARKIGI